MPPRNDGDADIEDYQKELGKLQNLGEDSFCRKRPPGGNSSMFSSIAKELELNVETTSATTITSLKHDSTMNGVQQRGKKPKSNGNFTTTTTTSEDNKGKEENVTIGNVESGFTRQGKDVWDRHI